MPQIVFGHGLWAIAADQDERFVGLEDVRFCEDAGTKSIWLRLFVFAHTLTRLGVSHQDLLDETGLAAGYREVDWDEATHEHRVLCFEQRTAINYTHQARDEVMNLVATLRPCVWTILRTTKPYRHYYTYMAPAAERQFVLPQMAAIYVTQIGQCAPVTSTDESNRPRAHPAAVDKAIRLVTLLGESR